VDGSKQVEHGADVMTNENLKKRNAYTAGALLSFTATVIPYVGENEIRWMMWRDTTVLAVALTALALFLGYQAWRVGRDTPAGNNQ
jgi:hypothetical protein